MTPDDVRPALMALHLKMRSERMRQWMAARGQAVRDEPYCDPHELTPEDWQALNATLEKLLTPEYFAARSRLVAVMRSLDLTFDSPSIDAWLHRHNVFNQGLTIELIAELTNKLQKISTPVA